MDGATLEDGERNGCIEDEILKGTVYFQFFIFAVGINNRVNRYRGLTKGDS